MQTFIDRGQSLLRESLWDLEEREREREEIRKTFKKGHCTLPETPPRAAELNSLGPISKLSSTLVWSV